MYKDIIRLLKSYNNVEYHYYSDNLFILSKITKYEAGTDYIKAYFSSGNITIHRNDRIVKVPRPANLIVDCVECYAILDKNKDSIVGYLLVRA
ncbi:MAG TPA: hypothetical protein VIK77_09160 [Tissierellaceae bacterium]